MTYKVYAMYPEGAYEVAEGNDYAHSIDFAARMCESIGQHPYAFATMILGQHLINAEIFSFEDLKNRKN